MISRMGFAVVAGCLLAVAAGSAQAQLLDRKMISLAEAKKMAAAAEAEAIKNKWLMVIVVADADGMLIYLERMDDVQVGSVLIAEGKARSSALLKRPTKALEDTVAGNVPVGAPAGTPAPAPRNVILALMPGITPIQGGLPIFYDGHLIGAIGCSGGTSAQDEQVCKAGLAVMSK